MSLFLDIAQGAGLASAAGVRPFLPPLLAGALASGDLGIDFDGTDYAFLESPGFLVAVLALAVVAYLLDRSGRSGAGAPAAKAVALGWTAVAIVLGALLFAGSLAAGDEASWPGLLAGAACALLGAAAARGLLARVRRRLDESAAALLPAWADLAALVLAGAAILFPPLALLGIAALAYLVVAGRRTNGAKYEGLRVLR